MAVLPSGKVHSCTLYAVEVISRGTVDLSAFFADLVRCETRLYNALNDRLRARHGIVTSQFEFLRFLRGHPGARVADLAAEFAIGIGATSKGVDRLEKQGWAVRQPNPADRRSSLLVLTGDGRRLVDAAEETFAEGLAELIGGMLDSASVSAAARAFVELRSALERRQIGTPTG
jgi:MarR family transcriptional regulator, multiple antibiotic resistance protein MarR